MQCSATLATVSEIESPSRTAAGARLSQGASPSPLSTFYFPLSTFHFLLSCTMRQTRQSISDPDPFWWAASISEPFLCRGTFEPPIGVIMNYGVTLFGGAKPVRSRTLQFLEDVLESLALRISERTSKGSRLLSIALFADSGRDDGFVQLA